MARVPGKQVSLDSTGFAKNLDGTVVDAQLLADAVDVLQTLTIVVNTEAEIDAAVTKLNSFGGGHIVIASAISLSGAKNWNLSGITIFADGTSLTQLDFPTSSDYLNISGGAIFNKVRFNGHETGDTQNALRFINPNNGRVLFLNCMFKNLLGDTNPTTSEMIRFDGSGGGGWTFDFIQCDCHSGDNNRNPFTMRNVGGAEYLNVGVSSFFRQEYGYNRIQFLGTAVSSVSKYASDGSMRSVNLPSQITETNWIGPSIIDTRQTKFPVNIMDEFLLSDSEDEYELKRATLYDIVQAAGVRTRYVATEDELDAAYEGLRELDGGIIYLTADIDLTEDKCWDLTDITIFGSPIGHYYGLPPTRIDFNGYQIQLIGAGCHFQDVVLNGTINGPTGKSSQTLLTAATYGCGSSSSSSPSGATEYDSRTYQFIRCQFRNCVGGLSTGNVIDLSDLNDGVGFDKIVTLRFEMCTIHTDGMSPGPNIYGLIVYVGDTSITAEDNKIRFTYMFVKDAEEGVWAHRNAFGLRKDDANNNAWLWHDDTVQVVEAGTNVGRVSSVGNQPYRTRTGSFTIANDEIGMMNVMTGDGARTINLGTDGANHNVSPGAYEDALRLGSGNLTITAPAGVTFYYENVAYTNESFTFFSEAGSRYRFHNVGTNEWVVIATHDLAREVRLEPMGFQTQDDTYTTISWNDGTTTFQIAPVGASFDVWVQGKRFRKTAAESVVGDGTDFTIAEGLWFFYYDSDGVLTASSTPWDLSQHASVALIRWDATNSKAIIFTDERHGLVMDWATHEYLHSTVRTRYESGLGLSGTTSGTGDADSDAQVDISDGTVRDEDIEIAISDYVATPGRFVQELSPAAYVPVFYLDGDPGDWRRVNATAFPVYQGTNRIRYNLLTGSAWSAVDAPQNGEFVAMYIYALANRGVPSDGVAWEEPIIAILGQRSDDNLADAQDNNTLESLTLPESIAVEGKPIYRLIFQTSTTYSNTPHARLRDVLDYRTVSTVPGTYIPTEHNALGGRSVFGAHPGSAISLVSSGFDTAFSPADNNVQAIAEIADKKIRRVVLPTEDLVTIAATYTQDAELILAEGDHYIDGPITLDGHVNFTLRGEPAARIISRFDTGPLFYISDPDNVHLHGFAIDSYTIDDIFEVDGTASDLVIEHITAHSYAGDTPPGESLSSSSPGIFGANFFNMAGTTTAQSGINVSNCDVDGNLNSFFRLTTAHASGVVVQGIRIRNNRAITDTMLDDGIVISNSSTGTVFALIADVNELNGFVNGINVSNLQAAAIFTNSIANGGAAATDAGIVVGAGCTSIRVNTNSILAQTGRGILSSGGASIESNEINTCTAAGIELIGGSGDSVDKNQLLTVGAQGISIHTAATNCRIINNKVYDNGAGYGISVLSGNEHEIVNNRVELAAAQAIYLSSGRVRCKLSLNTIISSGANGFDIQEGANNCTVTGNLVYNASGDGLNVDADGATVQGNYVEGCSGNGIELGDTNNMAANITCQGNTSTGNTGAGIACRTTNSNITGNLTYGNTGFGLREQGDNPPVPDNNHFADNKSHTNTAGNFDFPSYATNRSFGLEGNANVTDNALVGYDGTSGRTVHERPITVSDAGLVTAARFEGEPAIIKVNQAGHGFTAPGTAVCVIHHNGTSWVKAQANTQANAEGCWVVTAVADVDNFTAQKVGEVDTTGWGLTAATVYFLSATTAGAITATPPDTIGHVVLPIIYAHTTTDGEILHLLGDYITLGASGSDANKTWEFLADMLATPNTSDWGLNAPAAIISDPTNTAIPVAAFDDTSAEGVGMEVHIPLDATRIRIAIEYRAASAPGTPQTVDFRLQQRGVPDNAAIPVSWTTIELTALNVPANAYYQYAVYDTTLSALSLVADRSYLFELSRYPGGDDTLSGDLYVRTIRIYVKYDNVKWVPAVSMQSPLEADWAIDANAPIATDSNNSALKVRRHDDLIEEGAGIEWRIPLGTAKMGLHTLSRAETAPGEESYVAVTLWFREMADGVAISAWDAYDLPIAITIPTNDYFQYDFWEIDMTMVGLNPGSSYQFEVTRNTGSSSSSGDLPGDWDTWMYGFEWY